VKPFRLSAPNQRSASVKLLIRVTYEYDWTITEVGVLGGGPQPSFDKDDVLIGAGVRYFGTNNISGNLEWNKRLGRDDYDEDSFSITIRADF